MAPDAERVLNEALKLPPEQRAEVAGELLRSLDDEEGEVLDPADRARLHQAMARSEEQFQGGMGIPADVVLERLRRR